MKTQRRRYNQTRRRGMRVKISKTVSVPPPKDTLKAQMLTVAKRVTAKAIPNKVVGFEVENVTLHNSALLGPDMYPIVQAIATGDEQWERSGSRIKPKSLVVRGVLSQKIDYPDTQALYVRIVIAAQKTVKSVANYNDLDPQHLLKVNLPGGPQELPFSGNHIELTYPINRDLFRVYMDKIILLTPTESAAAGDPRQGSTKRWSYRFKQLPATLTFDQGGGNLCNNFAPFCAIGYAYANGTAPDTVTTRVAHSVFSQLTFEDA